MNKEKSSLRRFVFSREEDVSGISGTGIVCEGVEFSDGTVALKWLSHTTSVAFYANVKQMLAIHGHQGGGVVKWIDADPTEEKDEPTTKATTKKSKKRS